MVGVTCGRFVKKYLHNRSDESTSYMAECSYILKRS